VFIDYGTTQKEKGYRCLQLSSNKIFVSRNVQFDETQFSFKELPNSQGELPIHQLSYVALNLLSIFTSARLAEPIINSSASELNGVQLAVQFPNIEQTNPTEAYPTSNSPSTQHSLPLHSHSPSPTTTQNTNEPLPLSSNGWQNSNISLPTEQLSPITTLQTPSVQHAPPTDLSSTLLNSHSMVTRTKDRTCKRREFSDFVAHHARTEVEPSTFNQANKSPN
jgi:hypothetical protein